MVSSRRRSHSSSFRITDPHEELVSPHESKRELKCKLKNSWIPGRQAARTADIALDLPECAAVHCGDGSAEIRMIRQVERFSPQLQRLALANRKRSG